MNNNKNLEEALPISKKEEFKEKKQSEIFNLDKTVEFIDELLAYEQEKEPKGAKYYDWAGQSRDKAKLKDLEKNKMRKNWFNACFGLLENIIVDYNLKDREVFEGLQEYKQLAREELEFARKKRKELLEEHGKTEQEEDTSEALKRSYQARTETIKELKNSDDKEKSLLDKRRDLVDKFDNFLKKYRAKLLELRKQYEEEKNKK